MGRSCVICDTCDIWHICDICDTGDISDICDICGLWCTCGRPDACSGRAVSDHKAGKGNGRERADKSREMVGIGQAARPWGSDGLGPKVLAEDRGRWESGPVGQWDSGRVRQPESGTMGQRNIGKVQDSVGKPVGQWDSPMVGQWDTGIPKELGSGRVGESETASPCVAI